MRSLRRLGESPVFAGRFKSLILPPQCSLEVSLEDLRDIYQYCVFVVVWPVESLPALTPPAVDESPTSRSSNSSTFVESPTSPSPPSRPLQLPLDLLRRQQPSPFLPPPPPRLRTALTSSRKRRRTSSSRVRTCCEAPRALRTLISRFNAPSRTIRFGFVLASTSWSAQRTNSFPQTTLHVRFRDLALVKPDPSDLPSSMTYNPKTSVITFTSDDLDTCVPTFLTCVKSRSLASIS